MKSFYSIFLLLFTIVVAHAQPYETNLDLKRTYHWMFGDSVWLDFNFNPPHNRNGSQMSAFEPSASYSSDNGDLIVYSDGNNILNKNHQIIENGSGILGHFSSSQGAIFVPLPNNDSILYLFTTDASCGNNGLRYSIIKLHENPDSIIVVDKNIFVTNGLTESIKVTKHANNINFWIVVHSSIGNTFYSYMLTENGLINCPVTTQIGYMFDGHSINCQTSGDFNLNGNKFIINVLRDFKVILLDFSNYSGKFSNYKQYDNIIIPTGLAFSSNSSYVYIVERDKGIKRLNLSDNSFDTITQINQFDYMIVQIAFAPDGKIYSNVFDSSHLAIISDIDSEDPQFNLKAISVGDKKLTNGLPDFVKSYFYTPNINFTVKLDCVTNKIQFYGKDSFLASTHNWFISKQGAVPVTADIKAPLIEFEDTGIYTVRYIASNGLRSDTVTKEVTILPKIDKNFLGNDTGWCNAIGTPITLQAPNGMHCYEWNTGEANPQITADISGVYTVKITTPNFCVLYDTIKVSVDTVETIENNFLGEDKFWCKNLDTSVVLKAPENFTLYHWNNGSNEQQINISEEGVYYIEAFKRNQCANGGSLYALDTIEITLLNTPDKPTLNRIKDSLFINLSGDYIYNWFRNNEPLSDTLSHLILPDTGNYFLEITNSNGCSNNSDTLYVAYLGIENPLYSQIKLYPNPTSGVFVVEILYDRYAYSINDITGKSLEKGKLFKGVNEINISHLANGIYFIVISNNEQSTTYKIIKQTE